MARFLEVLRLIGGIVIVLGAALGITDWSIDPRLVQYIQYLAYVLMFLFGARHAARGVRNLRK